MTAAVSELDPPPLTAKVTEEACGALGLRPGLQVFLIVKAAACQLVDAERGAGE